VVHERTMIIHFVRWHFIRIPQAGPGFRGLERSAPSSCMLRLLRRRSGGRSPRARQGDTRRWRECHEMKVKPRL